MISPVSYPKSPFLTVLKPQETGGFSFAKEDKSLLTAGWILENSSRVQRTHVETLKGFEKGPQEDQSLILLLMCTRRQCRQTGLSWSEDNVSAT
jgi:hypothetical protein